jgi:plasmid stabilization system protein ParE
MSKYQFTPQAITDLFEIWSYIAGDNLDAANPVEEAIYSACALLAENPLAGGVREDLTALPVRFWLVQPFQNYWIVYNPDTKPLQVIPHPESRTEHRFLVGVKKRRQGKGQNPRA